VAQARSQVWASGKRKPLPWQKGTAAKRRRKRKKPGVGTALLGVGTLVSIVTLLIAQNLLAGLAVGLSASATAIVAHLETRMPPAGPTPDPWRAPPAKPRTPGASAPKRPAGGTGKPRKRVCSARCRASTKPVDTCNCVCGGATHGKAGAKISK
jgi:hypothetical protein